MKKIQFTSILLFLSSNLLFAQKTPIDTTTIIKPDTARESNANIFWTAIRLLDVWQSIGSDNRGYEWFVFKNPKNYVESYIKTSIMVYMPSTFTKGKFYKDVVLTEDILIDCKNSSYEILTLDYKCNFNDQLDKVKIDKPRFTKAVVQSIMEDALKYSCK